MGTNTQTAEPRVQVTAEAVAPDASLSDGFYAVKINTGPFDSIVVDAQKLPNLIHDLQQAQINLAAQAMTDRAGVDTPMADDAALMADLDAEELVDQVRPEFSSDLTARIFATGQYTAIWDALDAEDSPTWDALTDADLRAIIKDYRHTYPIHSPLLGDVVLTMGGHPALLAGAKLIFVGRRAEIEAADPKSVPDHRV